MNRFNGWPSSARPREGRRRDESPGEETGWPVSGSGSAGPDRRTAPGCWAICINVFGTLIIYLVLGQKVMKGLTGGAVQG
jgi:hypothetical protein